MTAVRECAATTAPGPLWARSDVRAALGETLRPGGFALTDAAADALALRPGMVVLDAGCGTGATVRRLRQRHGVRALGLDLHPGPLPEQISKAASGMLPLLRGRVDALPLKDNVLDALFCECVLSLQADPARVLAEFHRTLAPGGGLALSDLYLPGPETAEPAQDSRSNVASHHAPASCAHGALPRSRLLALLRDAGFRVLCFVDETPLLRNLAAQLAWSGCTPLGCSARATGYFLLIAQKQE